MTPDTTYEVWERRNGGPAKRRHDGERGLPKNIAEVVAKKHNDEEVDLARIEGRKVRNFYFVVEATTSFTELGAEAQVVEEPAPIKVEFFYTTHTPHEWSSGPNTFTYDYGDGHGNGGPIATLERAKERAEGARRGRSGYRGYVHTTYGVKSEIETDPL